MTYVVSDVHGCDKLSFRLLETLRFSDTDTLYILGDVTDRGSGGLRVLLDAASRQNVILLRGITSRRRWSSCPATRTTSPCP